MKKYILAGVVILMLVIISGYKIKGSDFSKLFSKSNNLTQEEAKVKVTDYINNNLMQPGTEAEITSVTEEGGLYKVAVDVNGQEINAYMTLDGTKFFPSAMDMNIQADQAAQGDASQNKEPIEIVKSEKPQVELFVMSYCPYGTQIEKGILPAVFALGSSIDFKLKFVDYAMHDKKELDENLRQYCIQKNEPEKLNKYMECFLKVGQGTENACLNESSVSVAELESCINSSDQEFKVSQNYADKNTWKGQFPSFDVDKADNEKYGVQGSPTLVINETVSQSGRDAASLLKTICSAFNEAPEACNQELSSAAPSPGFGEGTGSASTDANCGI